MVRTPSRVIKAADRRKMPRDFGEKGLPTWVMFSLCNLESTQGFGCRRT